MPLLDLIIHAISRTGTQSVRVVTQTLFQNFKVLAQVIGSRIEICATLSQPLTIGFSDSIPFSYSDSDEGSCQER